MRYRRLEDGDMTFGRGRDNFLVDSPAAVAQAVLTRLLLMRGEWFLDVEAGTPYATEILGSNTRPTYDRAIRERILGTQGVSEIRAYHSVVDGRALTVRATVETIYGQAEVEALL